LEDIQQDMYQYAAQFPKSIIPHITENNEICDKIHNYSRPKAT